jgi:carbon monoxide dehydrogenase subunit G
VRLENSFSVPASPEQVWELLNDVPRVVPNMPGARLDAVVDDNAWKATMSVKLGPVALEFAADVRREASEPASRQTTLAVKAREVKNRGGATATIVSTLEPDGAGTTVKIVTDLMMHGAVAQYGRAVVPDVAGQMVTQFAANLAAALGEDAASS